MTFQKNDVEMVLVGNELLKGERRDAHLAYVGQMLMPIGVRVAEACIVGDERAHIADVIARAVKRSRVVLVSGGLGPTHDDITREGVADGLDLPLEFHEDQWRIVQDIFRGFGREADESNRRQAYFPKGAQPIANPVGTAAGFVVEHGGCLVAVMPGPPRELVPMMESVVMSRINRIFGRRALVTETYRTSGVGESAMTPHVKPLFDEFGDVFVFSSLPHIGGVDIVMTQLTSVRDVERVSRRAREFEEKLKAYLGYKLYAKGTTPLEAVVGGGLAGSGATLAIAESLTGGYIGKRMTDIAGSSRYLLADVVAYSNESKVEFLGVDEQSLREYGAVSEAVCREMADGVRTRTGATFGLATTGIAGPDGGSAEKPVGLTYYGLSWEGGADIRHRVFPGQRDVVRERVCFAALLLLHRKLSGAEIEE